MASSQSKRSFAAPTPSFGRHDLTHGSPEPPPRGGSSMSDGSLQPPSGREAPACSTRRLGRLPVRHRLPHDPRRYAQQQPAAGRIVMQAGASLAEGGWRELSNELEPPRGGGSGIRR